MDSKEIIREFNDYVDCFVECRESDKRVHELLKAVAKLIEDQEERIAIMSEGKTGEWKRMSGLPIEKDDRFECSICGNVVHYHDRINLYTFNDYCGRCGSYNGFKFKDGDPE